MSGDISRREQIMRYLVALFADMRASIDGYTTTWETVVRRPLSDTEAKLGNGLGVYDVSEEKVPEIGRYRSHLTVRIEFFYLIRHGDEPSTELNRMLVDIQRAMRADHTCGGLAYNVLETENELDINGPADRLVAGIIEYRVEYKHLLDDPRAV
jgi:hypothetical protein